MAEWCGNNNQKCGIAEASEKGLYLVYLGSSAFTALKNYLECWPAICVHVQYKMIVFVVYFHSKETFITFVQHSKTQLNIFNVSKTK